MDLCLNIIFRKTAYKNVANLFDIQMMHKGLNSFDVQFTVYVLNITF